MLVQLVLLYSGCHLRFPKGTMKSCTWQSCVPGKNPRIRLTTRDALQKDIERPGELRTDVMHRSQELAAIILFSIRCCKEMVVLLIVRVLCMNPCLREHYRIRRNIDNKFSNLQTPVKIQQSVNVFCLIFLPTAMQKISYKNSNTSVGHSKQKWAHGKRTSHSALLLPS